MGQQLCPSQLDVKLQSMAPLLRSWDIDGLVEYIRVHGVKKVLVMVGAGASVAAGIPDFRSPNSGLYANLAKYPQLLYPEAMFEINTFRSNPSIFYGIAKDLNLWPDDHFFPTPVHSFIYLLQKHGMLLRCYTQNIDCLERKAGIEMGKLVEAHGTFATATCLKCRKKVANGAEFERVLADAKQGRVPSCVHCAGSSSSSSSSSDGSDIIDRTATYWDKGAKDDKKGSWAGLIKPDVVFFGEALPDKFYHLLQQDLTEAQLCLIIGTSLTVQPFADIPSQLPLNVPRVLINMEYGRNKDFLFQTDIPNYPENDSRDHNDGKDNKVNDSSSNSNNNNNKREKRIKCIRDLFLKGDAQVTVQHIAAALGWDDELGELMSKNHYEHLRINKDQYKYVTNIVSRDNPPSDVIKHEVVKLEEEKEINDKSSTREVQ